MNRYYMPRYIWQMFSILIGFYYIHKVRPSTLRNFIFILIKCYFLLYRLTLTTVFYLTIVLSLFCWIPVFSLFTSLLSFITSNMLHEFHVPKVAIPKNYCKRFQTILIMMQPKLYLLKLRSTAEVFCKSSKISRATGNQNAFYQLHLKFLWTFLKGRSGFVFLPDSLFYAPHNLNLLTILEPCTRRTGFHT